MDDLNIEFWHWWIAAVAFVAIEIFAPGALFLWLGLAAVVVGLVLLAVPDLDWEIQFLAFAVLSVIAVVAYRAYQRAHPTTTEAPTLNRRAEQYVGRTVSLERPIVNGVGRARIGDSLWRVAGDEDLPAGTAVQVVGVDGTTLRVARKRS